MGQLLDPGSLERLGRLAGPTITAAVELGAGVGRRTTELCSLHFACLDYDEHTGDDGERRASPVLVHDMPKVGKTGCRSTTGKQPSSPLSKPGSGPPSPSRPPSAWRCSRGR